MGIVIDIVEQVKAKLRKAEDAVPQVGSDHDATDDEAATGNPISDLYNRALTHPATTIGLLTAAVGVTATIAFVLAEQRAQKGIEREAIRNSKRAARYLRSWGEDEVMPRVKEYRRKYSRRLKRWGKRRF